MNRVLGIMDIDILDIIFTFSYFIIIICVSIGPILTNKQTVDYMVTGNKSQGPFQLGISLSATHLSSIALLSYVGVAFTGKLSTTAIAWSIPLVTFFSIRYFAPLFLKNKHFSAFSVLKYQFGAWASVYAAIWFILTQIAWVSVILVSMIKLLEPMLGDSLLGLVLIVVVASSLYTYFGGFKTVVKTDTIQWFCILIFSTVTLWSILSNLPMGSTVSDLSERISFGSFAVDLSTPSIWVFFLMGIVLNFQNFGVDQAFSQRCISLNSESDLKKFVWIATLSFLVLVFLIILIGVSLILFYPDLQNDFSGDLIPILTRYFLNDAPSGMKGLFVVGVLAAVMSSLDSGINSTAVVFLENLHNQFSKNISQKRQLTVINCISGLFGAVVLVITYATYTKNFEIGYLWLDIESALGSSIIGLFILKIIYPKSNKCGGIVGVLSSIFVCSWIAFGDHLAHSYMAIPAGCITCIATGLAVSYLTNNYKYD